MSRNTWIRLATGLVIVAAGALYLAGNGRVSLWDRDEPRYAECSRQMLKSGDWVVPRYLDHLRPEKPPLLYWCEITAMRFLGDTDFAARLPSVVAVVMLLAVLAVVIGRAVGAAEAFWTVFILASAGLVIASGKMCMTDGVLLLWITLGQICLFTIYRRHSSGPPLPETGGEQPPRPKRTWVLPIFMWVCIGLGGMTKGPIALVPPVATALVLWILDSLADGGGLRAWGRAARWLWATRPLEGLGILALIAGPWLIAVHLREPRFLPLVFKVAERHVGTSMEGHKGPPGYYLATVWAMFFPWSLLLPAAAVLAIRHWRDMRVRFALAAVAGPWVFQEIMKTKLPHYFLPVYPALAFLTADALLRCMRGQYDNLRRAGFYAMVGGWAVITVAVTSAPLGLRALGEPPKIAIYALWAASAVGLAWAIATTALFCTRRLAAAGVVLGAGMMAWVALVSVGVLPHIDAIRLGYRAGQALREEGATNPGDVKMIDFKEASLAFYQGGTITEEKEDQYLTLTPPAQWPRWLVVTDNVWNDTPAGIRQQWEERKRLHGLAYADEGRLLDVIVVRQKNMRPATTASTAPTLP